MSSEQPYRPPLSETVFEKNRVTLPWIVFVGALFVFIGMPFAKALVVCWVKGWDAYFREGIRIPKGKHPLHFTDGSIVPELPYALANFAVFFSIVGGLSVLLLYALRVYERRRERHETKAA
jgi:hypothetical protein